MSDQPIPFTPQAFQELKDKLRKLQQLRREVVARLQTAREMGDLSENAAYSAAKFELGRVNRELRQTRFLLNNGQVVEQTSSNGMITFGSHVTLRSQEKELIFQLVSQHESNPSHQKLSMESPIGKAIFGKKAGDTVTVQTPKGPVEYQILKVN